MPWTNLGLPMGHNWDYIWDYTTDKTVFASISPYILQIIFSANKKGEKEIHAK